LSRYRQSGGSETALPILPPSVYYDLSHSLSNLAFLSLTYTVRNVEQFARNLGDNLPPSRWDEERYFPIRAEFNAAFFDLS